MASAKVLGFILIALAIGLPLGACKKKKVTLSRRECQTFCPRFVKCFQGSLGEFARPPAQENKECVDNCLGRQGQVHNGILRAMKRCGHLTNCDELRPCVKKVL